MKTREKLLIRLLTLLILYVGRKVDGFYGYQLEEIIKEATDESDD